MDMNNAFNIIAGKTEKALFAKGYTKADTASSDNELVALYIGESAYSIVYTFSNKRIVLRTCGIEGDEPDNEWRTLATWLFDPETDGQREAESIGSDFEETISGPKQSAAVQKQKKRKKDGENNVDALFFANRMVTYFPELRDEIAYEKAHYEEFRGVTFAEEKIVPRFADLIKHSNEKKIEKISAGLAAIYKSGDLDTKGIITYDLFNAVEDDEKFLLLIKEFPVPDQKVAKAARKLRGKTLKAEKPIKKRKYVSDTLNN